MTAARCFDGGDLVRVLGKVDTYRGVAFVSVRRMWRVDRSAVEAGEFLPVAWRDVDELDGFLDHLAGEVAACDYRALVARASTIGPVPLLLHPRPPL
jgi:3'-5' exoribonuclease